jgi:predicted transcriptional regulator
VVEALTPQSDWNHRTIKTMLNRLVKKRAIKFQADGKRYFYSPAITRAAAVGSQSRSFLARVFGGDVRPMLAHFVEHEKLSQKQIAELRDLLQHKERRS